MTEQEAKQYKPGDKVRVSGPGPSADQIIVEVLELLQGPAKPVYWSVKTTYPRYGYFVWGVASSLCHLNPPQQAAYIISEDKLSDLFPEHKPADAPRPLCPAEGERETIDWEAHRRFMRGLG